MLREHTWVLRGETDCACHARITPLFSSLLSHVRDANGQSVTSLACLALQLVWDRRTAVNEYQYCVKATSYSNPKCMQRRRDFVELCPGEWVETWQEQIDEDRFMGIGDTLGPPEEEEEAEEEAAEEAAEEE